MKKNTRVLTSPKAANTARHDIVLTLYPCIFTVFSSHIDNMNCNDNIYVCIMDTFLSHFASLSVKLFVSDILAVKNGAWTSIIHNQSPQYTQTSANTPILQFTDISTVQTYSSSTQRRRSRVGAETDGIADRESTISLQAVRQRRA